MSRALTARIRRVMLSPEIRKRARTLVSRDDTSDRHIFPHLVVLVSSWIDAGCVNSLGSGTSAYLLDFERWEIVISRMSG